MISAKELENREKNKKDLRKEFYTKILSQMCRKIDLMNTLGRSDCILKVPEYSFGYPSYDIHTVTLYIHRQLVRLGYRCSIIDTGIIHTAWGKKKTEERKQLKQEDEDLPSLANLKKTADSLRKKYERTK